MGLLDFLFKRKYDNPEYESEINTTATKVVNQGEKFENELLQKYGECKTLENYGLSILFITDTHNCLAYTDKYLNYLKSIAPSDYDICILLGDLSGLDIDEIKKLIPPEKLFGVVGNHDSLNFLEENDVTNINGKVITCKGIRIAGIMGSTRYKEGNYGMQTQEECMELIEKMGSADILISHDKAFILDNNDDVHDGLKGITEYIYKNHIPLHIHGHLHYEFEEILKNGTKSIGLYQIKLLKI